MSKSKQTIKRLQAEIDALRVENEYLRNRQNWHPWILPSVQPNWEWIPPTWARGTTTIGTPSPEDYTVEAAVYHVTD